MVKSLTPNPSPKERGVSCKRRIVSSSLRRLGGAALLLLFIFSCTKPDAPPINEPEPVFYINASLDNAPLEINAGKNDYYM